MGFDIEIEMKEQTQKESNEPTELHRSFIKPLKGLYSTLLRAVEFKRLRLVVDKPVRMSSMASKGLFGPSAEPS